LACKNDMHDVALLLIKNFGNDCNPDQEDIMGYTAYKWALYSENGRCD
jgi:hypothetical protein